MNPKDDSTMDNMLDEDLPEEIIFDYTKAKANRFADDLKDQQLLVALDPDVAAVFGSAESVNRVLRALIETMPAKAPEVATLP
jgi:hypothetical protein